MSSGLSKNLQRLDDYLLDDAISDDAMMLSELDGFLAGLIVCPEMIMPSEWMPVIWGDEDPVFADIEQAQDVSDLILGHYNGIVRQLDKRRYSPLFEVDTLNDDAMWEIWIEGFVEAMRLRPDAWIEWAQDDDEDLQRAWFVLGRLGELATSTHDIEPLDIDEELEQLAPDLIAEHVEIMHHARLAKAGQPPRAANQNKRKVGRNEVSLR